MAKLRWGVLATGVITDKFISTVGQMEDSVVEAVASRDLAKAQAHAARYGIAKSYGSYEELVGDPAVDVVYVATPHTFHYENMMLCLEHGKHVLCEKSFTTTADEAKRVYARAKERGLFVMEAYWTAFLPAIAQMKEILAHGVLGEIHLVTAQYGFRNDARAARKLDPALAGGALLDIGIYNIAFCAGVLGYQPSSILTEMRRSSVGTDASSAITLCYPGGSFAQITTAIQTTIPQMACVCGSKGYLQIMSLNGPQEFILALDGKEPEVIRAPFAISGFEYQIREVQSCLAAGRTESSLYTPAQSIAVMEIMDQVRAQWNLRFPFEDQRSV